MAIARRLIAILGTVTAVTALQTVAAQPDAAPLVNPGFEEGTPGGPPAGWSEPSSTPPAVTGVSAAYRAVIDAENPHEGRGSARLEPVREVLGAQDFGAMSQTVDAKPYRGRRVRLTAAVRADGSQARQIGLWLRVDREAGRRGFFDNMGNRPITRAEWAEYTIEGDVAADAERILLGLLVVGHGRAWIDDVRLEDVGPATASAANADLTAYLDQALGMLRALHINSAAADWPAIETRARSRIAGSTQLSDAHDAIQGAITDLGERHSFLRPPAPPPAAPGLTASAPAMPTHELIGDRIGAVRLPGFIGNPEQIAQYTAALRDGLIAMDSGNRVCGWIIDLRSNAGGNMWPMLNGLDPLLGPGPFGSFRTPAGQVSYWVRDADSISVGLASVDRAPFFTLSAKEAPVAVLLGPQTASSGEMTAIALAARPNVRTFGAPSSGFATANVALPLSDGATLVITSSYARDRTGREYGGPIAPDEAAPEAERAAVAWLASQGC